MSSTSTSTSTAFFELGRWLRERLATLVDIDPAVIRDDEAFTRYGLDSARATRLIAELGQRLGRPLSPVLAFEHPTIEALIQHLLEPASRRRSPAPSREASPRRGDEPIAIVGLACRLPGASDPDELWQLLCAGRHEVRQIDDARWPISRFHNDDARVPGRAHTRWAGLLDEERLAGFDPLFFNISPREAEELDPQQRLFLELAWEALQDAGLRPFELQGTRTGVFAGVIWEDYGQLMERDPHAISMHTATGKARGMVANRVSYTLGLRGPSVVVDTACSSSLVAVHLACQSLLSDDSDLVVAGGINLLLDPVTMVGLSKFGGLSSGSMCRAFDAGADGFVRGEGGGVLVLKRLSRAIADGDAIRAVIRGSAVNNDGASNGLTAPSPQAQQDVIARAWERASVDPGDVDYVEAHGTGTALGDPIEAKALGAVLGGERRSTTRPLRIGSIKSNIGHLEAAAGIAGLIKAVLSLEHGMLPPSLHVERLNPYIPFEELRLRVQTTLEPWPARADAGPRRAGVSAFGWGGTNCHVALEAAPHPRPPMQWRLAAEDEASLRASARAGIGHDAVVGGGALRIAVTTDEPERVPERLEDALAGRVGPQVARGRVEAHPRLAFVCSPQGGQWRGMAHTLLARQPVFGEVLHELHEIHATHASWSLLDALTRDDADWAWERVHTIQPMIVAVQLGLAALWRAWGIVPDLYVGHSLGEITAAHLSGALELEDAWRLVLHYSRLQATTDPSGTMAIVGLSPETVRDRLQGVPHVVLAGENGPESSVVSGPREALEPWLAALRDAGTFARFIDVNVAAHSPSIDPIMDELRRELHELRPRPAHTPMISTLSGRELTGLELGAEYWPQNLREPVRFSTAVRELCARGVTAFVELSPHPILVPSLHQCLAQAGHQALVLESTRRGEDETRAMLEGLGRLFVTGHDASCHARYAAAAHRSRAVLEDPSLLVASPHLALVTSGRSAGGLRALVDELGRRCAQQPERSSRAVARGLAQRDCAQPHRRVALLEDHMPAATAFDADGSAAVVSGVVDPRRRGRVVFVCPGQGSQWRGMGRDLLASQPVFFEAIARIDRVARRHLTRSLLAELLEPEPERWSIEVVQPLLFAVEVGLGELWRSWGVEPDAVVGHSMGEVAAFYLAGALSLEHAVQVICLRSRLLRRISGRGAMLAVELSAERAREAILGHERDVAVAVDNGPCSTVLAGDAVVLEGIRERLDGRGVFCRWVKVDVASHSPQMDPLLDELRELLAGVVARPSVVPILSTVSAARIDGAGLGAEYWVDNLRQTVRFHEAIQELVADGHDTFVELSPHPILLQAVEQVVDASGRSDIQVVASMRREEAASAVMLESAALLYSLGHPIRWTRTMAGRRSASVIGSPWEREPHWFGVMGRDIAPTRHDLGPHPLLGVHLDNALDPRLHLWQLELSVPAVPWLADHRVRGSVVASAAVLVEMLLAALAQRGLELVELRDLALEHPLVLSERGHRTIQIAVHEDEGEPGAGTLGVFSRGPHEDGWIPHLRGRGGQRSPSRPTASLEEPRARVVEAVDVDVFTQGLARRGLAFGPAFRPLRGLWRGPKEALAQLALPEAACPGTPQAFRLHPVLLDGALQIVLAALGEVEGTFVTVGIERLSVLVASPPAPRWSHAWVSELEEGRVVAHVTMFGEDGRPVVLVEGLRLALVVEDVVPMTDAGHGAPSDALGLVDRLREEPAGPARRACFEALVREQLAAVLKTPADRIELRRPLQAMGLTSLMSIELRNRLGALVGRRLPSTLAWNYPTLEALVDHLGGGLDVSLDHDDAGDGQAPGAPSAAGERVPEPSPAAQAHAIDAELLDELSRIDALLASV